MEQERVISLFEETGALLSGHFELRSGLHSDRFFQCALLLQYPRVAASLCEALVDTLRVRPEMIEVDTVIAPALGGISVGHEIARLLGKRFIFVEKNDRKELELRRFTIEKGERFLVAEDVITRGGRVQETVDLVDQHGGVVCGIGVLVDRSGGKAVFRDPLSSLLEMEPVTWPPESCPLCKQGVPLVHPGS